MFNPNPRIERLTIAPEQHCLQIDDALSSPERWVDLAVQQRAHFQTSPHNAYPGIELRLPERLSAPLDDFFARHLRRHFDARRTLRMYSRLSMVTRAPEQLSPAQWICHRDRMELDAGRCVIACVLYLFDDPALGGTSFYVPRHDARQTAQLVHDSGQLSAAEFSTRYEVPAGYMTASNRWFAHRLRVPARWNRLLFYNGMTFHAGDILAPQNLSDDPRRGRLTLNGFFTCRSNAG